MTTGYAALRRLRDDCPPYADADDGYVPALWQVRGQLPPHGYLLDNAGEEVQLGQIDFGQWAPPTWQAWAVPALVGTALGAAAFWFFFTD